MDGATSGARESRPTFGEMIELVACDIAARPAGAPLPSDLTPHLRSVERADGALTITFAAEAADQVAAFAAAERACCAGIGWEVRRDPLVLRITAGAAQLDAIAQLFASDGFAAEARRHGDKPRATRAETRL